MLPNGNDLVLGKSPSPQLAQHSIPYDAFKITFLVVRVMFHGQRFSSSCDLDLTDLLDTELFFYELYLLDKMEYDSSNKLLNSYVINHRHISDQRQW
jgi:hypothetical protein